MRNLLITFLLGGLWHGAAWTFVFWGLLWGAYQSVHVRGEEVRPDAAVGLAEPHPDLRRRDRRLGLLPRLVVRAAKDVLQAMLGLNGVSGEGILRVAPVLAAFIVGGLLWVNLLPNTWQIQPRPKLRYALLLGILLAASLLALSKPSPFLYVQF